MWTAKYKSWKKRGPGMGPYEGGLTFVILIDNLLYPEK